MNTDAIWQQPLTQPAACDHIAQVYQDEAFLADAVRHFVGTGLRSGDGVLVIATAAHWETVKRGLEDEGLDLERSLLRGQLAFLDADVTLSSIMVDGMPAWAAVKSVLGGAVERMRLKHAKVRLFGEMVDLLWREGKSAAMVRLEEYWNEIIRFHGISRFCAYFMDHLDAAAYGGPLESICHTHTHLIPTRHYDRLDKTVSEASSRVLDKSLTNMMETLARIDRPATAMPFGQIVLFWLRKNMPMTADRVLAQVRGLYGEPAKVSRLS